MGLFGAPDAPCPTGTGPGRRVPRCGRPLLGYLLISQAPLCQTSPAGPHPCHCHMRPPLPLEPSDPLPASLPSPPLQVQVQDVHHREGAPFNKIRRHSPPLRPSPPSGPSPRCLSSRRQTCSTRSSACLTTASAASRSYKWEAAAVQLGRRKARQYNTPGEVSLSADTRELWVTARGGYCVSPGCCQ